MDDHRPLVSVLMPTYNVAPFVEEAVRSILDQTYRNFELIIVDDCSSDGTYEILKRLADLDHRIVLDRNDTNSKICITLNKAWSLAKGDFIARMDGDDLSMPERLEVLLDFLNGHPDVDLVGSQVISINETGEVISQKQYLRTPDFIKRGNKYGPAVVHIWMARSKVYEALNGYRNIPFAEDYDFLLRGETIGFRYANVEEYLYKVRIRSGNTGSANGLKQRKTKDFVYKINHETESTENVEVLYDEAIKSTKIERERYEKAHTHLDIAILSRKKPWKLAYHVIARMIESRYISKYMTEAVKMRILLSEENKKIPRKISHK